MTTFTTEDRVLAEKVDNLEVLEPIPFAGMIRLTDYQDLLVPNRFSFRFFRENNEWVCRMPDWLMDQAKASLSPDSNL